MKYFIVTIPPLFKLFPSIIELFITLLLGIPMFKTNNRNI